MSISTSSPTLWSVARRPRWIAALVFALILAAGFAALGQWQLERGIASAQVIERDTESVTPLAEITSPQRPTNTAADGQLVEVSGSFVPESWIVLSGRSDGSGDEGGAWLVGRFDTDGAGASSSGALGSGASASGTSASGTSASVAVAVGWAPTVAQATSAIQALDGSSAETAERIVGRYLPGEPPQLDDFESGELSSLSPPALVNLWPTPVEAVYGGYIVADTPAAGLTPIVADAPTGEVQLNWLNIFYAVEWVVFAGFAVYMWFRLVKDAWERETDPGLDDDMDLDDDPDIDPDPDADVEPRASAARSHSVTSVN